MFYLNPWLQPLRRSLLAARPIEIGIGNGRPQSTLPMCMVRHMLTVHSNAFDGHVVSKFRAGNKVYILLAGKDRSAAWVNCALDRKTPTCARRTWKMSTGRSHEYCVPYTKQHYRERILSGARSMQLSDVECPPRRAIISQSAITTIFCLS